MWNKIRPVCAALLAAALWWPATAHAQTHPHHSQAIPSGEVVIQGAVVDARTGAPLENVYVRQKSALNATFTDAEGHFQLRLLRGFNSVVVFEVEGYEPVALPFRAHQEKLKINLQPLLHFTTDLPPVRSVDEPENYGHIIGNQFTLFYQGHYGLFSQNDVTVNGLVLNEFGLSYDLIPFYPLNFRGRFFRSRQAVDIANFPFQPAFFINQAQAKVGAGWVNELSDNLDAYLGGDVILDYRSPDNRNNQDQQPVAFTGSLLDFEQTRLGFGLNGLLAWEFAERFAFFPELTVYPLSFNFIDSVGAQYTPAADITAKLRAEIVPGAYVVGQYSTQLWYSFGANAFENNHFVHLGVSLDPWSLAAQLL